MSAQNDYHSISDFVLMISLTSGIPRNSERDWSVHLNAVHEAVHCFADWFALHLLTSFFRFRSIMKRQQKLSSFFTKKRMAGESEKHEDFH